MIKEELLKGLTEEQIEKAKACKSQEELLKFASEEDIDLSDEQLAAVSGGCGDPVVCPYCGSSEKVRLAEEAIGEEKRVTPYYCSGCRREFYI